MTKARLILAVVSTILEEVAIVVIWRWGLPQLGINLPLSALIGIMVAWAAFSVSNFIIVTRVLRKQVMLGLPTMVGTKGKVTSPLAPEGLVRIKSELWSATSLEGNIDRGEEVMVVGEDGLKLIVRRRGADNPGEK
jgi:membrane-bound serine protease (ClpP class)